jgi:hypothetical protein
VLTEVLTVTPGHTADPRYQPLAVCYKQLNFCVGRFATAALVGDTHALASGKCLAPVDQAEQLAAAAPTPPAPLPQP